MGEIHKLNNTGGGAFASLVFRFFLFIASLNIMALPVFYFKLGMENFSTAEIVIVVVALLVYLPKREANSIRFENGKITVKGKHFLFFNFTKSANYTKIKYKFTKPAESRKSKNRFFKPLRLALYNDNKKWVEFTGGAAGWSRIALGDLVKTLIAKGCYNWFEFNKKSRRKK